MSTEIDELIKTLRKGTLPSTQALNFAQISTAPDNPRKRGNAAANLGMPSDLQSDVGQSLASSQEEPSYLSKLIDFASAPLYTVTNTIKDIAEADSFGEGFSDTIKNIGAMGGRLVTGLDDLVVPDILLPKAVEDASDRLKEASREQLPHYTVSDILEETGAVENPIARGILGFAGDVALDPLSWLTMGAGGAARRGTQELLSPVAGRNLAEEVAPVAENPFVRNTDARQIIDNIAPTREDPSSYLSAPATAAQSRELPLVQTGLDTNNTFLNDFDPAQVIQNIMSDPSSMRRLQADENFGHAARRYENVPEEGFVPLSEKAQAAKGVVYSGKSQKVYKETVRNIIEDIGVGRLPAQPLRPVAPATGIAREVAEEIYQEWAKKIPTKATARGKTDLNPANQTNLWNSIFNRAEKMLRDEPEVYAPELKLSMNKKTGKMEPRRNTESYKQVKHQLSVGMLRAAEDAAIAAGRKPQYWDGTHLRLSDLINEIGPDAFKEHGTRIATAFAEKNFDKITDTAIKAKIAELSARSAVENGVLLERAASYVPRMLDEWNSKFIEPAQYAMERQLTGELDKLLKTVNMTETERAVVKRMAQAMVQSHRSGMDNIIHRFGKELQQAKRDGVLPAPLVSAFNNEIQNIMGLTPTAVAKKNIVARVGEEMGLRLTTWYGRGPMKRVADNIYVGREVAAKARFQTFSNLMRDFSPEELENALQVAQGNLVAAGRSERELEASRIVTDTFEKLVGSKRMLANTTDFEGTVAFRSAASLNDVNQALKDLGSKFQFKQGAKGEDWSTSWQDVDWKEMGYRSPAHLLYDLDLAMERVTSEYSLVDTFVRNFGARRTDKHFNPATHTKPLAHSRGGDYYFEAEHVEHFNRLLKDIHDGMWSPRGPLMKNYARGLSAWKRGVTIYLPSHHIRNMIGDMYLTWVAGHNSPMDFIRARKILGAQRAHYKDVIKDGNFDEVLRLTDPEAASWNSASASDVILRQGDTSITAGEIYKGAFDRGLLLNARQLEDIPGDSILESIERSSKLRERISQPFGGAVHDTASNVSEYRDHFVRIHHFTAAVNKELKRKKGKVNLEEVYDKAAAEVRKYHPDGRDLTQFEQKTRLAIPFYSWTRKAIPLIAQSMVLQPGKSVMPFRAVENIQSAMGIEQGDGYLDPFPDDQLFPSWMRASGIGPVAAAHSDNPMSSWLGKLGRNLVNPFGEYGYTLINPGNPLIDTFESQVGSGSFEDLLGGITGMISPAAAIPAQIYGNRTGTGRPIYGDEPGTLGLGQYAVEQVPALAPIQNILELGRDQKPNIDSRFDLQALMNYMTALGVQGTSPYIKSAEFEIKG